MDVNIRMIDLSQLTQHQAKRVALSMQRGVVVSVEQDRSEQRVRRAALSY